MADLRDNAFDRPVFIVCPPRSGSSLLFEALLQAPELYTIGGESHHLIEGVPELNIRAREFSSNRLTAEDATPAIASTLRTRFRAALRDRDGRPPAADGRIRMLEKTPKNSLRIPFLARIFPEARFVYLHRDPRQVLASMIDAWESGRFKTYLGLPGWPRPHWSLLLTPGWQALAGKTTAEIVAAQWEHATRLILDDLAQLPDGVWQVSRYDRIASRPREEIARLCSSLELPWDRPIGDTLPLSRYTMTRPDPEKWRRHEAVIASQLPGIEKTMARADALVGDRSQ